MEQSNITGPLERAEAQALTDRIRNAIDDTYALVTRAKDGLAWKALSYPNWDAYVQAEFGMSKRRADQLLEKGKVVEALVGATGEMGNAFPISKRDVDAVKDNLPVVTAEIKQRVEAGEAPAQALKETVDAAREAKAKVQAEAKAQQADNDRQRDEVRAALPSFVAERESAKQKAVADRKAAPVDVDALQAENEELREANASLIAEVEELKAELKKLDEMRVQFEQGGFEKVIAGKDEEIRVLETRVYTESEDKASWMKSAKYWQGEAKKLGHSRYAFINVETGEVTNG